MYCRVGSSERVREGKRGWVGKDFNVDHGLLLKGGPPKPHSGEKGEVVLTLFHLVQRGSHTLLVQ